MEDKLMLQDLDLEDKRVLMRVDFNVPLDDNGQITDDTRIREALPSIQYILQHDASLILMSHLGRPKGKKNPKMSLAPCAKRLSDLLHKPVYMAPDCIGPEVEKMVKSLKPGEILLLENLRFYDEEENPEKNPSFAKNLSKLGDLYVNDAFGTAHRAHSSTAIITQYFPDKAAAGFLIEKEIAFLGDCLEDPKRPFYAVIGGSKISTKIGAVVHLAEKVDALFLGGGMFYTFMKMQGKKVGDSICEEDQLENARKIIQRCQERKIPLYLPVDIVIAKGFSNDAEKKVILASEDIPDGWQGMSIGPKTIEEWKKALHKAKMVFWNGPLGVFEFPEFAKSTMEMAAIISDLHAITIAGGGDSIAAINAANVGDKFSHLSTGGGASLEFLEFGHLPGIDALSER
ncbi:MAG: phosphoglycerate kinase [Chlamydiota bacterium]